MSSPGKNRSVAEKIIIFLCMSQLQCVLKFVDVAFENSKKKKLMDKLISYILIIRYYFLLLITMLLFLKWQQKIIYF